MKQLKIVIADDHDSSRKLLRHFVSLLPHYQVVGEAANGEELVQLIANEKPDIALVDIHMPNLDGMKAVKSCKELFPTLQVIFTTGCEDFAVEAFNVAAADYIVKPIEPPRLFSALEKARKLIQLHEQKEQKKAKRLDIKLVNSILFLPMEEILFIEKESRKTVIHTSDEKYETNEPLSELADRLEPFFLKTHRSYIINLKKIIKIEAVGETYWARFACCDKVAYISKLKIHDVQQKILQLHD
ncbi:two-component system LytT family response regulator [Anoxybacillus voinovskiensis]|uniref:Two-component system LytT family response regulator n=1 Tax=Anoxybacteroides voinovskiense TaxID=230470 RepID=A0A840DTC3_9BACL|nr:LytTR family DNA-binding domain-containing protein [Anoxybacillus voinovskiensis]MBB4072386.1 two-component system LytT family response regulator [Anoxybacillus voinovskiensis]GGJ58282.1 DNA-binding response regulator [Anoxybacillus voinovskiensis]